MLGKATSDSDIITIPPEFERYNEFITEIKAAGDNICALTSTKKIRCWGDLFLPSNNHPKVYEGVLSFSLSRLGLCVIQINQNLLYTGYNLSSFPKITGNLVDIKFAVTSDSGCYVEGRSVECWRFGIKSSP